MTAHAAHVSAGERARLAALLGGQRPPGSVLLQTCHRLELYGGEEQLAGVAPIAAVGGARLLVGAAAERHLVRLAVGLESAVVGEDQLLHQLREAIGGARRAGGLPAELDRLLDFALRAGRRARSWLPRGRGSLAEAALARVLAERRDVGDVLVVGAGDMGRRTAAALRGRARRVLVASRTPERARALAGELNVEYAEFDPGAAVLERLAGAVVALGGEWRLGRQSANALIESDSWLIDLSAPPALPASVRAAAAGRLVEIDDLAHASVGEPSPQLRARLDALVVDTVADFAAWRGREHQRAAARALNQRADDARQRELNALWQRLPALDDEARAAVEEMAARLTDRLMRDPLERLQRDEDGRRARAARELFGL